MSKVVVPPENTKVFHPLIVKICSAKLLKRLKLLSDLEVIEKLEEYPVITHMINSLASKRMVSLISIGLQYNRIVKNFKLFFLLPTILLSNKPTY
jgi:hypothetical protein